MRHRECRCDFCVGFPYEGFQHRVCNCESCEDNRLAVAERLYERNEAKKRRIKYGSTEYLPVRLTSNNNQPVTKVGKKIHQWLKKVDGGIWAA